MTNTAHTGHKDRLLTYFNGVGFERWSAIYGAGPVSRIRQTVREGHQQMLTQAMTWVTETRHSGTLVDAGAGTGLFSVAMAQRGFDVTAVDIAPRMVAATRAAAIEAGVSERVTTRIGDIESINTQHDIVTCFDVLVHYPRAEFVPVCQHLAEHTRHKLLLTYAPYNSFLAFLHWLGGHFPKGERRTEIQMIRDEVVAEALTVAGLQVTRKVNVSRGFYHVTLLEATRPE